MEITSSIEPIEPISWENPALMDGYKHTFNRSTSKFNSMTSVTDELFEKFRSEFELYGFIDNGDHPPDLEADSIAKITNLEMYEMYKKLLPTRIKLGYSDHMTSIYSDYTNLDSRHIMMFVILFTHIPSSPDSILEIGGGFGQWLTLNKHRSFSKWTIIDLPHVSLLQNWYLDKQGISKSVYETVSALDYDDWNSKHTIFDLVIGTHSVSEFAFDVFYTYFNKIIIKSKYFYFCYSKYGPSPELIQKKLNVILTKFEPIVSISSENDIVINCLYKIKV